MVEDLAADVMGGWYRRARASLQKQGRELEPVHAALFDAAGKAVLHSADAPAAGMAGALASARKFFEADWSPGDLVLTNDADAGAINACEMIVVAPVHRDGEPVAFIVVRGHVPDLGGWESGGFSPQAVDRWAEGARIEPVKLAIRGRMRREVTDILKLNSRTPNTTLENVHALADIAARLARDYLENEQEVRATANRLHAGELSRLKDALARRPVLSGECAATVHAPWISGAGARISASVAAGKDGLQLMLSGPPVSPYPVNLGRYAAEDIALAALAGALGLKNLLTCAVAQAVNLEAGKQGMLAATLPAAVGIGRESTGRALFEAVSGALGVNQSTATQGWQAYQLGISRKKLDPASGKLTAENARLFRDLESTGAPQ